MNEEAGEQAELRAERLKERVYITFTALAVVLALRSHGADAEEAAVTLVITVVGTLLAVFVADVVSHVAVHAVVPTKGELRGMLRVTTGAFGAVVLPLVFIGLGAAEVWTADQALRAATIALVVALSVVGYLAVRRVRLPLWQKVLLLLAEVLLGVGVIALEYLAHG